jgi:hypothetical protein
MSRRGTRSNAPVSRDLLVGDLDRAQRMRHRPGRLRDDARIPGIGLRLTLVKVRETGHREAWEIADQDPLACATATGSLIQPVTPYLSNSWRPTALGLS